MNNASNTHLHNQADTDFANQSPALTLRDVTVCYGRNVALRGVSGSFAKGSLTAVAGPNGAGKSTLLKAIAGLIRPRHGTVIRHDAAARIAYMPQTTGLRRDAPLNVELAATTGLWPHIGGWRAITQPWRDKVDQALATVGLLQQRGETIGRLSGGQWQRLLFARVILQDAPIILLDEPFASVDAETTAQLMQVTLDWHYSGRTVICVLHDLWLVRKYFPESFVLAGHCLGSGHTHAMFEQKLLSFDLDMAELVEKKQHNIRKG